MSDNLGYQAYRDAASEDQVSAAGALSAEAWNHVPNCHPALSAPVTLDHQLASNPAPIEEPHRGASTGATEIPISTISLGTRDTLQRFSDHELLTSDSGKASALPDLLIVYPDGRIDVGRNTGLVIIQGNVSDQAIAGTYSGSEHLPPLVPPLPSTLSIDGQNDPSGNTMVHYADNNENIMVENGHVVSVSRPEPIPPSPIIILQ